MQRQLAADTGLGYQPGADPGDLFSFFDVQIRHFHPAAVLPERSVAFPGGFRLRRQFKPQQIGTRPHIVKPETVLRAGGSRHPAARGGVDQFQRYAAQPLLVCLTDPVFVFIQPKVAADRSGLDRADFQLIPADQRLPSDGKRLLLRRGKSQFHSGLPAENPPFGQFHRQPVLSGPEIFQLEASVRAGLHRCFLCGGPVRRQRHRRTCQGLTIGVRRNHAAQAAQLHRSCQRKLTFRSHFYLERSRFRFALSIAVLRRARHDGMLRQLISNLIGAGHYAIKQEIAVFVHRARPVGFPVLGQEPYRRAGHAGFPIVPQAVVVRIMEKLSSHRGSKQHTGVHAVDQRSHGHFHGFRLTEAIQQLHHPASAVQLRAQAGKAHAGDPLKRYRVGSGHQAVQRVLSVGIGRGCRRDGAVLIHGLHLYAGNALFFFV